MRTPYTVFVDEERGWPRFLTHEEIAFAGLLSWGEGPGRHNVWYVITKREPKGKNKGAPGPAVYRLGDLPNSDVDLPPGVTSADQDATIWHRVDGDEAARAVFQALLAGEGAPEPKTAPATVADVPPPSNADLDANLAKKARAIGGIDRMTIDDIKHLMLDMYDRGRSSGAPRAVGAYPRSQAMQDFQSDVWDRYRRIHGDDAHREPAFYYGTFEVQLNVTRGRTDRFATAAPVVPKNQFLEPLVARAFDLGIGDTSMSRLGGPRVITDADTNLQNPGQTLFSDELFLAEGLSARVRGVRLCYAPEDIARMAGRFSKEGTIENQIVRGQVFLEDETAKGLLALQNEHGAPLPPKFNRLAKQLPKLANACSLHFIWQDRGIGGGGCTTDALIEKFGAVPGSLGPAKLGGPALALPQGYIITLDKMWQASRDQGGNGLFGCDLLLEDPVGFLFEPAAGEAVPTAFAVSWEIRIHGTSLLPHPMRRHYRAREMRHTRP